MTEQKLRVNGMISYTEEEIAKANKTKKCPSCGSELSPTKIGEHFCGECAWGFDLLSEGSFNGV